jgi:transposase
MVRYRIKLSKREVEELTSLINKGSHSSQSFRAAYVLLNCDEGEYSHKVTNKRISEVLQIGMRTVERIKKRFVEGGLESALQRAAGSRVYAKKLDGEVEAKLVSLCCSDPPEGFATWSLRMLAGKMVELKYVESISYVSVRKLLKKTNLSLGKYKVG